MILKKLLGITILSALMYFQLSIWKLPILGLVFLCLHFLISYKGFYLWLIRFFGFSVNTYTKILGGFSSFFVLSFFFGIAVFFNGFQNEVISILFLMNGLVSVGLEKYLLNYRKIKFDDKKILYFPKIRFPFYKILSFIYFGLIVAGFYFLYISKTGDSILSPWQTIHPVFIYIFFFATLILGFLIFTKLKIKTLLLFLILYSFLLHAYLPLTHEYFYGGDQWRHTAVEGRLLDGLEVEPSIEGENTKLVSNFSIGKLTYSNFWGGSTFLSKVLQVNLIDFNKWFLPILFSLILPILLFELGRSFRWGRKESLFLVFVGSLPFAIHSLGSMTLPVSFGFLPFVLSLILLLRWLKSDKKEQLVSLAVLGMVFLFGYLLYFILFWLFFLSAIIIKKFARNNNILIAILITTLILVSILVLEIIGGYSFYLVNYLENYLDAIKQIIGNFSGFYLATGPRTHDILTGNILFNQTPSYSFVKNTFVSQSWLVPILAIGFWMLFFFGMVKSFVKKNLQLVYISSLSLGLSLTYIISRYFLDGENILARRLDMVLGLLFIILFTYGLFNIVKKYTAYSIQYMVFLILVLSFAITASYSLGPDTKTVSKKQYQAMEFIWENEKENNHHCVFADTYPLLSLEAISKKEIIGGGLPIDKNFSQKELNRLYDDILISDNLQKVLEDIKTTCQSKSFWVLSDSSFKADKFGKDTILKWNIFEDLFIWQIKLK